MDMHHLEDWIGKSVSREERIAPFPSNALAQTLNRDDASYEDGSVLPHLWHWLHFLPLFKMSEAGYDGHAALGGFLPPVPLPRRMWAASRFSFHAPMRIGQTLRKVSTVKSVKGKDGRTGKLVFVTVGHQIFDGDCLCVDEDHDIVYREMPSADAPAVMPPVAPETSDFSLEIKPDPVLLFRYSALTFNGHRIHYDQPFCTGSEGYEGLVVHGPLLATMLMDLLRRHVPEADLESFEFRALGTVFDIHDFSLHGQLEPDGNTYSLWVKRHDGAMAMKAKATVR